MKTLIKNIIQRQMHIKAPEKLHSSMTLSQRRIFSKGKSSAKRVATALLTLPIPRIDQSQAPHRWPKMLQKWQVTMAPICNSTFTEIQLTQSRMEGPLKESLSRMLPTRLAVTDWISIRRGLSRQRGLEVITCMLTLVGRGSQCCISIRKLFRRSWWTSMLKGLKQEKLWIKASWTIHSYHNQTNQLLWNMETLREEKQLSPKIIKKIYFNQPTLIWWNVSVAPQNGLNSIKVVHLSHQNTRFFSSTTMTMKWSPILTITKLRIWMRKMMASNLDKVNIEQAIFSHQVNTGHRFRAIWTLLEGSWTKGRMSATFWPMAT